MTTCAAYAPANSLQKANSGSNWRLSSGQVGGTECSYVCHVPGQVFLQAFFFSRGAPSQFIFQAPGACRSQHRLSSFLQTKYGSRGCSIIAQRHTKCPLKVLARRALLITFIVISVEISLCQKRGIHFSLHWTRHATCNVKSDNPTRHFTVCITTEVY